MTYRTDRRLRDIEETHQPGTARPAPSGAPRVFSDKRLMDNAEADKKILRRARELADERNARPAP